MLDSVLRVGEMVPYNNERQLTEEAPVVQGLNDVSDPESVDTIDTTDYPSPPLSPDLLAVRDVCQFPAELGAANDSSEGAEDVVITCATLYLLPSAVVSLLQKVGQSLHRDGIHCGRHARHDKGGTPVNVPTHRHDGGVSPASEMTKERDRRPVACKSEIKVKNIYRKPSCRSGSQHRSHSTSRFSNNRTNSCKLRRSVSIVCGVAKDSGIHHDKDGGVSDIVNDTGEVVGDRESTGCERTKGTENMMEDVFRHRSCSLPEMPPSILKNRVRGLGARSTSQRDSACSPKRTRESTASCKRASFREKVDVYCYTTKDAALPCFVSEKGAKHRNKSKYSKTGKTPDVIGSGWHGDRSDKNSCQDNGLIRCVESSILPCIDAQGCAHRRLHMKLWIDECCLRDKTSVKALSGGKAVIVHLYPRAVTSGDGGKPFLESKMPLPLQVDPYSVKARVHKDGMLAISANIPHVPLKSTEQDDDENDNDNSRNDENGNDGNDNDGHDNDGNSDDGIGDDNNEQF